MPQALDAIIQHPNFNSAFLLKRGTRTMPPLRKALLEEIYTVRSALVHSGIQPIQHRFGFEPYAAIRRDLLANFAENAILAYIQLPSSSLIGHPMFEKCAERAPSSSDE